MLASKKLSARKVLSPEPEVGHPHSWRKPTSSKEDLAHPVNKLDVNQSRKMSLKKVFDLLMHKYSIDLSLFRYSLISQQYFVFLIILL